MRLAWAILGGLAIGGAAAWWLARQEAPPAHARPRPDRDGNIRVEDHTPALYRWRDANGILHITERPPEDHPYERLSRDRGSDIQVRGARAE
ncbi:MAG: DUF4124 domain-containing protein [Steroidobacteraceae bacterium]